MDNSVDVEKAIKDSFNRKLVMFLMRVAKEDNYHQVLLHCVRRFPNASIEQMKESINHFYSLMGWKEIHFFSEPAKQMYSEIRKNSIERGKEGIYDRKFHACWNNPFTVTLDKLYDKGENGDKSNI